MKKQIYFTVDEDIKKAFKIKCVQEGKSQIKILENLMQQFVTGKIKV